MIVESGALFQPRLAATSVANQACILLVRIIIWYAVVPIPYATVQA